MEYGQKLNSLEEQITNLTSLIEEFKRSSAKDFEVEQADVLSENFNRLKNNLDEIQENYNHIKECLENLNARISEYALNAEINKTDNSGAEKEIKVFLEDANLKFEESLRIFEDKISHTNQLLESIDSKDKANEIKDLIESMVSLIAGFNQDLEDIKSGVSVILENNVSDLDESISFIQADVSNITEKFDILLEVLNAVSTTGDIQDLKDDLGVISASIVEILNKLEFYEAQDPDFLKEGFVELENKLNDIQDSLLAQNFADSLEEINVNLESLKEKFEFSNNDSKSTELIEEEISSIKQVLLDIDLKISTPSDTSDEILSNDIQEIKTKLNEINNLEHIENIYKELLALNNLVSGHRELQTLQGFNVVESIGQKINELKDQISEIVDIETSKFTIDKLENLEHQSINNKEELNQKLELLNSNMDGVESRLKDQFLNKADSIKESIEEINDRLNSQDTLDVNLIVEKIAELKEKIFEVNNNEILREEFSNLETSLKIIEGKLIFLDKTDLIDFIAKKLEELNYKEDLKSAQKEIQTLSEAVKLFEQEFEHQSINNKEELNQKLELLKSKIEESIDSSESESIKSELFNISNSLIALEERLEQQNSDNVELLKQDLEGIKNSFLEINNNEDFENIHKELLTLNESITILEEKLEQQNLVSTEVLQQNLEEFRNKLEELDYSESIDSIKEELLGLNRSLNEEIASFTNGLDNLEEKFFELRKESEKEIFTRTLTDLAENVENIQGKLSEFHDTLYNVSLNQELNFNKEELNALKDTVGNELEKVKEELSVNKDRFDHLISGLDDLCEELVKQSDLGVMLNQVQILQNKIGELEEANLRNIEIFGNFNTDDRDREISFNLNNLSHQVEGIVGNANSAFDKLAGLVVSLKNVSSSLEAKANVSDNLVKDTKINVDTILSNIDFVKNRIKEGFSSVEQALKFTAGNSQAAREKLEIVNSNFVNFKVEINRLLEQFDKINQEIFDINSKSNRILIAFNDKTNQDDFVKNELLAVKNAIFQLVEWFDNLQGLINSIADSNKSSRVVDEISKLREIILDLSDNGLKVGLHEIKNELRTQLDKSDRRNEVLLSNLDANISGVSGEISNISRKIDNFENQLYSNAGSTGLSDQFEQNFSQFKREISLELKKIDTKFLQFESHLRNIEEKLDRMESSKSSMVEDPELKQLLQFIAGQVTAAVEGNKKNSTFLRKIDHIEQQVSGLDNNLQRMVSYLQEE